MGEVEAVEHGRDGPGRGTVCARRADRATTPAPAADRPPPGRPVPQRDRPSPRNSPPALLAPPIWLLPAHVCGMVHRPGTCRASGMVTHTISVVPHSTSTSPSWSAPATICSHRASMAPIASTAVGRRCTCPTARSDRLDPRHLLDRRAALGARRRRSSRSRRTAGTPWRRWRSRSPPRPPARSWPPPEPASTRPRRALGRPSSAGIRRPRPAPEAAVLSAPGHPAPAVAVQQPRRDRPAAGVDGGQRRHHRRNGDRAGVRRASWSSAANGPRRQASSASCSSRSGAGTRSWCGIRARAATRPSSSAATALTAVVPMSMPIVTSLRDTGVTVRQHWQS